MSRCDVLVVGAGLVGSAAAWHLARSGAATVLVDAADVNGGASGQNAGSLHFQIERRFLENGEKVASDAAQITAISRMAIDEWRGLEGALGETLHVRQDGGLMVAETAEQVAVLETKVRREQQASLGTVLLDGAAAREKAPYIAANIIAAAFLADEGHADPKAVTPAFLRAAVASGARLQLRTRVVAIGKTTNGFAVTLDGTNGMTTLSTSAMLVAAGAWTARVAALANIHLPLFPVALSMNVTERMPAFMPLLIQHVGRRLSMKQAYSGNVLIGGGWPARLGRDSAGHFDPAAKALPIAASLAGNLDAAIATVPGIANASLLRSWTGVTAVTSDQLPLVGAIPNLPGFFVAAGGSAFTLGPTFARYVAERMLASANVAQGDPMAILAPARFDHLNGFMG